MLYSQDERCDGDYFDPAYTQVERILEVQMPEDWDNKKKRRNEGDKYDYGMVMDRADPKFDDGAGRQLLIKWGNLPYSEATYEFERDLILNDIEYEEPLNDFVRRNKKPTKADRRAYLKSGVEEQNRLRNFFGNKDNLSEEEHEAAVNEYKQQLQDQTYKNGGQLRDYQAEGVAWMISNFVDKRSCILADEMGLVCRSVLRRADANRFLRANNNTDIPSFFSTGENLANCCHCQSVGDQIELWRSRSHCCPSFDADSLVPRIYSLDGSEHDYLSRLVGRPETHP